MSTATKKSYPTTSISFPDQALLKAGKKKASDLRITFSQYVNRLIEADLAVDAPGEGVYVTRRELTVLQAEVARLSGAFLDEETVSYGQKDGADIAQGVSRAKSASKRKKRGTKGKTLLDEEDLS